MPLLTLSVGLVTSDDGSGAPGLLRPRPVRVAIGDADIFEELIGREESGSWPLGLGPKRLKPAALIGQDILSQRRYLLSASEPALYMTPDVPRHAGHLDLLGEGDCLDDRGRRLRGLQKLACTPDEAAEEC